MHIIRYILFLCFIALLFIISIFSEEKAAGNLSLSENYVFVTKWGAEGTGDGEFRVYGVDPKITDETIEKLKDKISKEKLEVIVTMKDKEIWHWSEEIVDILTTEANFTDNEAWAVVDACTYQGYDGPESIKVDKEDNIYILDCYNYRIQKFDSNGKFITKWKNPDNKPIYAYRGAIAIDSEDYIYIGEGSDYILKFNSNGVFITNHLLNGQFYQPVGIATDPNGYIYVLDHSDYIQKFDPNGKFIEKWLEFDRSIRNILLTYEPEPVDIAIDREGYVYIILAGKDSIISKKTSEHIRVKPGIFKLSPSGELIKQWGQIWGDGEG